MSKIRAFEIELVPELHFAIRAKDGRHTSANFIVQCHQDDIYKLVNPKNGEFIQVRVHAVGGVLSGAIQEVLLSILGGDKAVHQTAEVISMSGSLSTILGDDE